MVASLDGAEYALLDSGSSLTSCLISYATTFKPASNATGGSVEWIGQRQVAYRLEADNCVSSPVAFGRGCGGPRRTLPSRRTMSSVRPCSFCAVFISE